MAPVEISECRLRLGRPVRQHEAPPLHSVFGRKFEEDVLTNIYQPDGTPLYQYPPIQFKLLDRAAFLLGINEGSELLQRLWPEVDEAELGDHQVPVLDSQFETRTEQLEATAEPIEYRFATPWLALNQKNFREYVGSRNQRHRKDELSRILVGNCLGMAQSLGVRLSSRIAADCRKLTSIKTSLNGNGVIGFVGKFTVNLTLPDHIGLGKSVSRGFGTVQKSPV